MTFAVWRSLRIQLITSFWSLENVFIFFQLHRFIVNKLEIEWVQNIFQPQQMGSKTIKEFLQLQLRLQSIQFSSETCYMPNRERSLFKQKRLEGTLKAILMQKITCNCNCNVPLRVDVGSLIRKKADWLELYNK